MSAFSIAVLAWAVQVGAPTPDRVPLGPELIEPVAALRVQVPPTGFVLRGTVPLPPGTYVPGGRRPLQVVDADGRVLEDTQVEVVSRYPDPADGADVVEVIARVKPGPVQRYDLLHLERPAGPDPGTPDVLDLIGGPRNLPDTVQALVVDPDALLVVATDPLGNRYVARPLLGTGSVRLHRYGPYMATVRTYGVLEPEDPAALPPGAYPHMAGVHAYLSTLAEEELLLFGLRLNNAPDGFDGAAGEDDLIGDQYFERLDVYVADDAAQWYVQQQFVDRFSFDPAVDAPGQALLGGRAYRVFHIVEELLQVQGSQPQHLLPCKSQTVRRLVVSPEANAPRAFGILDQIGLGFAAIGSNGAGEPFWSWWNPDTARYFPQRARLAKLAFSNGVYSGTQDLRNTLNGWYAGLRDALAKETPFPPPEGTGAPLQFGWARPLGAPSGNASGGSGIQYVDGDRTLAVASINGFRYLQLRHRLHTDRMPNVVWDRAGDATHQDRWLVACPGCPPATYPPGPDGTTPSYTSVQYDMDVWSLDPDFCPAPGWAQNVHVAANGLEPWYETNPSNSLNITDYGPHNMAHHSRYSRLAIALAWIGNDAIARDDVRAQAEMFRFTYTEYPNAAGSGTSISLATDRQFAVSFPGWGYETGRGDGWGLHAVNAAWALADDAWRARNKIWYDRLVDTLSAGMAHAADPNFVDPSTSLPYPWGVLVALQSSKLYGVGPGIPRARQVWEEMILQNGLRGIAASVYAAADPRLPAVEGLLRESYYGLVAPVSWNEAQLHVHETCPVSPSAYAPPPGNVYDCDPTAYPCAGSNPLPGPPYAPFDRDDNYVWSSFAAADALTGDPLFLQRALQTLNGGSCASACAAALTAQIEAQGDPTDASEYSSWSNQALLLGHTQ